MNGDGESVVDEQQPTGALRCGQAMRSGERFVRILCILTGHLNVFEWIKCCFFGKS